jgi:hypothetical protein
MCITAAIATATAGIIIGGATSGIAIVIAIMSAFASIFPAAALCSVPTAVAAGAGADPDLLSSKLNDRRNFPPIWALFF